MKQNDADYGIGLLETKQPMLLAYDIECTGVLGYSYGVWDTNIHKVIEQPILLSFSYAWIDINRITDPEYEPEIFCRTLADMDTYAVNPKDDRLLTIELHALFQQTDVTIGHNSKQFDDKMSNMFFLKHRLAPVVPHQQLDTKLMAKQIARFPSNSLNYLSDFFGLGQKTETTHADLWWDILCGGADGYRASMKMAIYNNQDVKLTFDNFRILYPWYRSPVNLVRLANLEYACPHCLQSNYHNEGTRATKTQRYQRFKCDNENCNGWFSELSAIKKADGDVKPAVAS